MTIRIHGRDSAGLSVLRFVHAFREACRVNVPFEVAGHSPGDIAALTADPAKVEKEWGWRARMNVAAMYRKSWRFQQFDPGGYANYAQASGLIMNGEILLCG